MVETMKSNVLYQEPKPSEGLRLIQQKQPSQSEGCFCIKLLFDVEQVKGVEPSYQAWEACVLPMNYTCGNFG